MKPLQVISPYPQFFDLDGTALDNGKIFIGRINEDPEVNPIDVFWDYSRTIPAAQPIRTLNGFPHSDGTPANIYFDEEYSITVRNNNDEMVFTNPVGYGLLAETNPATVFEDRFEFLTWQLLKADGIPASTRSVRILSGLGAGIWAWDATSMESEVNIGDFVGWVINPDSNTGAGRWIFKVDQTTIRISEQDGTDNEEKLNNAIGLAQPGQTILGEDGLDIDLTAPVDDIPAYVNFSFNGSNLNMNSPMTHAINALDENTISQINIDAKGNNTFAVLKTEGSAGVTFALDDIKNFSTRIIDARSSATKPLLDFKVVGGGFHKPSINVGHPILIASGIGGFRPRGVTIENVIGWGVDRNEVNPTLSDYTASNNYTADMFVIQGCDNVRFINNEGHYSGSSGVSITRGSSNIVIKGNTFDMCYEPGYNIGSGYNLVHVADISNFEEQDYSGSFNYLTHAINSTQAELLQGESSGTGWNRPVAIIPDLVGNGGWIGIETMIGGEFQTGYDIGQNNGASSSVTPANPGERDAGKSYISAAHNVTCEFNTTTDDVIQGGARSFNFIRASGHCLFSNNSASKPRGEGDSLGLISNSNSKIGYGHNFWQGKPAPPSQYTQAGPVSEWLFKDGNNPSGVIGGGHVSNTGIASDEFGIEAEQTSTGQYLITVTEDLDGRVFRAVAEQATATRRININYATGDENQFGVTVRDYSHVDANDPQISQLTINAAFTVTVFI